MPSPAASFTCRPRRNHCSLVQWNSSLAVIRVSPCTRFFDKHQRALLRGVACLRPPKHTPSMSQPQAEAGQRQLTQEKQQRGVLNI
jgi:hypothetical protein